ncbi:unnamed protein product [Tuber melanosporum]|uniref:(Perigord truffle) hypothetical protein n=1 Tax=Tuber melanosporum (strain Mel28) TaxID=656061 RepID=D5G647_TUBMM|nr:uncharacterized protein GSTUM_00001767001 [Tuber melanosporum]CAZ79990.1 unnamed protein product [Tuber melanosporum]
MLFLVLEHSCSRFSLVLLPSFARGWLSSFHLLKSVGSGFFCSSSSCSLFYSILLLQFGYYYYSILFLYNRSILFPFPAFMAMM